MSVTYSSAGAAIADAVAQSRLTAGGFIVTLFGDVVEPRGGRLATGALIEACGRVELNPTQVRTAVSRLVAAGRLEGEREGRRSQYRLTPMARAEFAEAAQAIFAPKRPEGWRFLWAPEGLPASSARRIGPEFWLAPEGVEAPGLAFVAASPAPDARLAELARKLWPVEACEADYAAFYEAFARLEAAMDGGLRIDGGAALTLRLLLTHAFRKPALADPGLPAAALPAQWRGAAARGLFRRLYLALSPAAERAIPDLFNDGETALPQTTPASQSRLAGLRG